jgi:hypothetical protein
MTANPIHHRRTKHIEIDIHFVREKVALGQVCVLHVPSSHQFADIMSKGLPVQLFTDFRSSLVSVRLPLWLRAGVRYIELYMCLYCITLPRAYTAYLMKGHPLQGCVVFAQLSTVSISMVSMSFVYMKIFLN